MKKELELTDNNLKKTIEDDFLNRNSKLVMLSKLLANLNENIMIAVDGKWGSGKTFFVKQFKYLIDYVGEFLDGNVFNSDDISFFKKIHDNSLVVYYNAWENDMHTDVLQSLIFNILDEYPNLKNQVVKFGDFKQMFKSFLRDFIYSSSKELFDINNIDSIKSFKDFSSEIVTIQEKKVAFDNLVDNMLGEKNRLILIIDELDRCKPSFAVALFETIKHFYTNEKITIIVSTNNLELSHTIRNYYGSDFDGFGYLNKFYDFVISLEVQDIKGYLQKALNFCTGPWIYHDMCYFLMDYYNFSFRECNRFITLYRMLNNYISGERVINKSDYYVYTCLLLPMALVLKIHDINNYNLFMDGNGEEVVVNFLNIKIDGTKYEKWFCEIVNDEDYKKKIIDSYYEIFNENVFNKFPFFEAISMLGTDLIISN